MSILGRSYNLCTFVIANYNCLALTTDNISAQDNRFQFRVVVSIGCVSYSHLVNKIHYYNTVFLSDKVLIIDPIPAFSVNEACNLSTIAPIREIRN